MSGRLVLVATPIGNLGDLSPRAVATLQSAAAIVCEDTRRTGRLLAHAGVQGVRMLVANAHTEAACAAHVGDLLDTGVTVAVVTDAGTPGVSDPGERLVRVALAGGHVVEAVPGPSALLAAVVVSGLPTDRFVMEGFLPRSGGERADRLADVATERRTVVLYEAPHRIRRTVADLVRACGPDRPVALARELTKLHEEHWRGTLAGAVAHLDATDPRGEYVVVLGGAPPAAAPSADDIDERLDAALAAGAGVKQAATEVADRLGLPRREVYDRALARRRTAPNI